MQLELTSQETQNQKQQNALTQLKSFLPALFTPHCTLHTFAIASCPQTKNLLKISFLILKCANKYIKPITTFRGRWGHVLLEIHYSTNKNTAYTVDQTYPN
jgi:hypothetical protein